MEPLKKGHFNGAVNSAVILYRELLRDSQNIKTIEKVVLGTSSNVLCRGVCYSVSLFGGSTIEGFTVVLFQRFHMCAY